MRILVISCVCLFWGCSLAAQNTSSATTTTAQNVPSIAMPSIKVTPINGLKSVDPNAAAFSNVQRIYFKVKIDNIPAALQGTSFRVIKSGDVIPADLTALVLQTQKMTSTGAWQPVSISVSQGPILRTKGGVELKFSVQVPVGDEIEKAEIASYLDKLMSEFSI